MTGPIFRLSELDNGVSVIRNGRGPMTIFCHEPVRKVTLGFEKGEHTIRYTVVRTGRRYKRKMTVHYDVITLWPEIQQ